MKHLFLSMIAALPVAAFAQQSYTFTQGSEPYVELASPTVCTIDPDYGFFDISALDGQVFHLFGLPFTAGDPYSMAIGENGYLRIDSDTSVAVIDGLFTLYDTIDATTQVAYSLTGTAGSHVLVAEWRNFHLENGPAGNFINLQIKVEQATGVISIHFGPNSGGGMVYTSASGPNCGVFHAEAFFSQCYDKLWVEVDPFDPDLDSLPNFDFDALHALPAGNTVYRFIPQWTTGMVDLQTAPGVTGWVQGTEFMIASPANGAPESAQLLDVQGRILRGVTPEGGILSIPLADLPVGVYIALVRVDGNHIPLRFVKL